MPSTEYIKQLTAPSFVVTTADVPTPPQQFEAYFANLESMRMAFVEYLTSCDETVVKAYLQELEGAMRTIEKRCFIQIREDDIVTMLTGGLEKEAYRFKDCKTMDLGLMSSARKTVAFINTVLNVKSDPVAATSPQPHQKDEEPKTDPIKVISSIKGLANFIGCKPTKANEIVQGGVLKEAGIQYMVGNRWRFNAEKLSRFLAEHPEILGPKRVRK